jgi:hypothetical protein
METAQGGRRPITVTPETQTSRWKQPLFWLFATAALIGLSGPFAAGWTLSFVELDDPTDPIPTAHGIQAGLLVTTPALIWWLAIGWSYLETPLPAPMTTLWAALPRIARFLTILAAVVFLGPFALVIILFGWLPFLLSLWPWVIILPLWGIWELAAHPRNGAPTRT